MAQNPVLDKGSPYLPLFNTMIHEFRESGVLDRAFFNNPNFQRPELQFCSNLNQFEALHWSSSITPFMILLFGLGMSVVLLIFEKVDKARAVTEEEANNSGVKTIEVKQISKVMNIEAKKKED